MLTASSYAPIQEPSALQAPSATPTSTGTAAPGVAGGLPPSGPPPQPLYMTLIPIVLIIAVFYFVLLRPEKKQRQKREALLKALTKGQRVLTNAGIYGTITSLQDDVATLEVDNGVHLKFSRAAIQQVLTDDDKK